MRITRFFNASPLIVGSTVTLDARSMHHAGRVLRLRKGESVVLVCGDGYDYHGTVVDNYQGIIIHIEKKVLNGCQPSINIKLFIALLKNDAMDRVIQKSVELGVSEIIPIITERSERKWHSERSAHKKRHWQGIITASTLQCGRAEWMKICDPITLKEGIPAPADINWLMSPHHGKSTTLTSPAPRSIAVMIGPEGGFSFDESTQLIEKGWQPYFLGYRVLRADTAAIVAITQAQIHYGDL